MKQHIRVLISLLLIGTFILFGCIACGSNETVPEESTKTTSADNEGSVKDFNNEQMESAEKEAALVNLEEAYQAGNWEDVITYGEQVKELYAGTEEAEKAAKYIDEANKELEAAKEAARTEAFSALDKQYDEVEKNTWWYPPEYPEYTNIRCYIIPYLGESSDPDIVWMRLLLNYTGDDWVFWEKAIFSVDGENYTITPNYSDIVRDNTYGGDEYYDVWEICDIAPSTADIEMLEKIAQSDKTIIRFKGSSSQYDYTVTSEDKAAISKVLKAYKAATE